jgi:hypothetical protein
VDPTADVALTVMAFSSFQAALGVAASG